MSKQKEFFLRDGNGNQVPVSEEVYQVWHQEERHERYMEERDHAYGVTSLNHRDKYGKSLEACVFRESDLVERHVIQEMYFELLSEYLDALTEEERLVLGLIFEEGLSENRAAKRLGWSRKKVRYWRDKALRKLRSNFEREGITEYQL